jgi:P-type conjugative transfer protein TrbL
MVILLQAVSPPPVHVPSDILSMFSDASHVWQLTFKPIAQWLCLTLAVFDIAYTAPKIGFHASVQTVLEHLTKQVLRIGLFLTLIVYGTDWMQTIIDSFVLIGMKASGIVFTGAYAVTPSNVYKSALDITGPLAKSALDVGFLKQLAIAPMVSVTCFIILAAYVLLTLAFIMYKVQTIISVSMAYIHLGFGGSSWTLPYAERYITMVISAGFRLMVFFIILSFNRYLVYHTWIPAVQHATGTTDPILVYMQIMGEVVLWTILCWLLPAITSHMLSGSLSLDAQHLIATIAPSVQAGIAATSVAANSAIGNGGGVVGTLMAGASKASSAAAGAAQNGAGAGGGTQQASGSPPPQPAAPVGAGMGSRNGHPPQPKPPKP